MIIRLGLGQVACLLVVAKMVAAIMSVDFTFVIQVNGMCKREINFEKAMMYTS